MIIFAETSFLCSTYRNDIHSAKVSAYLGNVTQAIMVTSLVLFEYRQSLRLQNFQNSANAAIGTTTTVSQKMMAAIQQDLTDQRLVIASVDWSAAHQIAETLSAKHTGTIGCRFADILHVAAAIEIGTTHFLSFDSGQRALAEAEGLTVP
jgi:predicted nucleic acid-binding protein